MDRSQEAHRDFAKQVIGEIKFSNGFSLQNYDCEKIQQLLRNKVDKLYKYCALDKNRIIALQNDQVFGNSPENFNDPLDSFMVSEYERLYVDRSNNQSEDPLFHRDTLKLLRSLRVTCFSSNTPMSYDSYLMWSHYADYHRGICVEYEVNDILKLMTSKFMLSIKDGEAIILPCFYHGEKDYDTIEKQSLKGVFFKHDAWAYEKEYRLIFNSFNGNYINLKPSKIFVGCNISDHEKQFIKTFCKDRDIEFNDKVSKDQFGYKRK